MRAIMKQNMNWDNIKNYNVLLIFIIFVYLHYVFRNNKCIKYVETISPSHGG